MIYDSNFLHVVVVVVLIVNYQVVEFVPLTDEENEAVADAFAGGRVLKNC